MYPKTSKLNQFVTPPRAGAVVGAPAVLTLGVAALFVDLRTINAQTYSAAFAALAQQAGIIGNYLTLLADGADAYVIFGPTQASVTGANAPVIATAGVVNGGTGAYTAVAGTCWKIPSGTSIRPITAPGVDLFMGYIGSAAALLRLYQSSPAGQGIDK